MIERDCSINYEIVIVIVWIKNWLTVTISITEYLCSAGRENFRKNCFRLKADGFEMQLSTYRTIRLRHWKMIEK